jgi:hypothetical protein
MAKSRKRSEREPWERAAPKRRRKQKRTKLSSSSKTNARKAAKKAGRPYPNLVDNMREAAKQKRRSRGGKARKAKKR